jgi:hypothetical protein
MMRTDGSHRHEIFSQDGVRARGIDWADRVSRPRRTG